MFTTVQDSGREGFGAMGISAAGAADPIALRLGNRLVGNVEGAPGLEMTLVGGAFVFPEGALLALTGADFGATLDGTAVEMWTSLAVRPGQMLRLGPSRSGARAYLSVRGGISTAEFLGSASTHVLSGLGGFEGRALRKGDLLRVGAAEQSEMVHRRLDADALARLAARKVLRVTGGPQKEWFPNAAQTVFYESRYRVAEESNRM
jgi:antagonist of KipI